MYICLFLPFLILLLIFCYCSCYCNMFLFPKPNNSLISASEAPYNNIWKVNALFSFLFFFFFFFLYLGLTGLICENCWALVEECTLLNPTLVSYAFIDQRQSCKKHLMTRDKGNTKLRCFTNYRAKWTQNVRQNVLSSLK